MCGILCLIEHIDLSLIKSIQHRGQESYGISYFQNDNIKLHQHKGLIDSDTLSNIQHSIDRQRDNISYILGHTRYSTSGTKTNDLTQSQPISGIATINGIEESFILIHNGNIHNRESLKTHFKCDIDLSFTDTQIIVSIIESFRFNSWKDILNTLLNTIPVAYSIIIGTRDKVYVMRDSYGVRPLTIGRHELNNTCFAICSENNALEEAGFTLQRDVFPGEILSITIGSEDIIQCNTTVVTFKRSYSKATPCLFEYIYFMNKLSNSDGINTSVFRYNCGKELAKKDTIVMNEIPTDIIVVGAPETGITSAIGYADELNLNYHQVLIKQTPGRTFILPNDKNRIKECNSKYKVIGNIVDNKTIVLVDDSLVRGNTIKSLISLFREKGAKKVHVRIVSPPVISPCYYGIDIPSHDELIAHDTPISDINHIIGSDTLMYLDIETIKTTILNNTPHCSSCFTGTYDTSTLQW